VAFSACLRLISPMQLAAEAEWSGLPLLAAQFARAAVSGHVLIQSNKLRHRKSGAC
jgi:hypothetical protein